MLILDLISEFKFVGANRLLPGARRVAPAVASLKARAKAAGVPVIYVNDTAGKWESDQTTYVDRCLAGPARGRDVVAIVKPDADDYFIFKPKHSGFYATPLNELLARLGIDEVILTGMTTHQCVLFTAVDAYVRDLRVIVPRDCVSAGNEQESAHALFVLRRALKARTPKSVHLPMRRTRS